MGSEDKSPFAIRFTFGLSVLEIDTPSGFLTDVGQIKSDTAGGQ